MGHVRAKDIVVFLGLALSMPMVVQADTKELAEQAVTIAEEAKTEAPTAKTDAFQAKTDALQAKTIAEEAKAGAWEGDEEGNRSTFGKVGIGAASLPDKQLFVKGDTAIESDDGLNKPMLFLKDDLGNDLGVVHASKNSQNGRGDLSFSTSPIPGVVKERMKLTGDGKLAVSLGGDPQETVDVGGNVRALGFFQTSDARLKTDVTQLTNVLEKLGKLRGVSFAWHAAYQTPGHATGRQIGVIAQEVEAVFPELVTTWSDEGYKGLDYGRLTGVLIEAAKELKAATDVQQRHMAALQARLMALEQAIGVHGSRVQMSSLGFPIGWPLSGGLFLLGLVLGQRWRAGSWRWHARRGVARLLCGQRFAQSWCYSDTGRRRPADGVSVAVLAVDRIALETLLVVISGAPFRSRYPKALAASGPRLAAAPAPLCSITAGGAVFRRATHHQPAEGILLAIAGCEHA